MAEKQNGVSGGVGLFGLVEKDTREPAGRPMTKAEEALAGVIAEDTAILSRALDSIHEFLDTTPDDTVWDGSEVKAMMRVLSKILRGVHVEDAHLGRASGATDSSSSGVTRALQEIERAYAEFKPHVWVSDEATSGLECPQCRGACVIAGDGEEEPCDLCDCTGVIRR